MLPPHSFTRDISYSMENLGIDSLFRWKLIEQSFLTTSLNHFLLEWLGEFALWAWEWKDSNPVSEMVLLALNCSWCYSLNTKLVCGLVDYGLHSISLLFYLFVSRCGASSASGSCFRKCKGVLWNRKSRHSSKLCCGKNVKFCIYEQKYVPVSEYQDKYI